MIRTVILTDAEEQHEPPSMTAMRLSVVDNDVYISLGSVTEGFDESSFTGESQIRVGGHDLLDALWALGTSDTRDRESR